MRKRLPWVRHPSTSFRRSCHGDDDLALVIARAEEPKRFRQIGELVRPVNHRYQVAGFKQLIHVGEVLVLLQAYNSQVLVEQARNQGTQDQCLQQARN